jgi:MFS transporter, FHS family, L-fucose permease
MTQQTPKSNALPIAVMFALFFMIAFVTGLPSPMGVIVAKQFGATNFMSQLGFFANFIAYAFMGIPAGMMLKRKGYKFTALTAVTVGFIGVGVQFLSGQMESFAVYLTGAFISGFSMCLLNTVVNPMLNTLGGGGNKGNQLLQLGGSFNSIAATITPMLVGYLMGAEAGRTIGKANPALFLAMGIFAIAFLVLLFVQIPEPHLQTKAEQKVIHKHSPLSFRHFIFGIIAIFIYVGVEIGIPSTANLYMTTFSEENAQDVISKYNTQQADPTILEALQTQDEANKLTEGYSSQVVSESSYLKAKEVADGKQTPGLGIDAGIAGIIVGIYWLLMMCGRLIGGAIGSKVSTKTMLSVVSAAGLLFLTLAIILPKTIAFNFPLSLSLDEFQLVPISILFIVLCGLCTSVMWGGIFNLAVEGLGKYTASGSGWFMVMVCGGGIIPLLQGFVADVAGYTASYWVMFACIAYLLWYALIGCKNVNKDIPVE